VTLHPVTEELVRAVDAYVVSTLAVPNRLPDWVVAEGPPPTVVTVQTSAYDNAMVAVSRAMVDVVLAAALWRDFWSLADVVAGQIEEINGAPMISAVRPGGNLGDPAAVAQIVVDPCIVGPPPPPEVNVALEHTLVVVVARRLLDRDVRDENLSGMPGSPTSVRHLVTLAWMSAMLRRGVMTVSTGSSD
jgi:hypothetical protein